MKKQSDLETKLAELEESNQVLEAKILRLEKQNKELTKKAKSISKRVHTKLKKRMVKLFATLALIQYKSEWNLDTCVICGKPSNLGFDAGSLGQFGMCIPCFDAILNMEEKMK